jgi:hypothetical protein
MILGLRRGSDLIVTLEGYYSAASVCRVCGSRLRSGPSVQQTTDESDQGVGNKMMRSE